MGISSTIMKHPSLEQDISLEIVEITIIKKFQEGNGLNILQSY